jgi:hypothetical protein
MLLTDNYISLVLPALVRMERPRASGRRRRGRALSHLHTPSCGDRGTIEQKVPYIPLPYELANSIS